MPTIVINRAGWLVAGVLALFVVAAMTGIVHGGPLDPPGPPASTQKTLDQIAPVWSQVLAANDGPDACHSSRFLCVLSDAAVLDRETGLVWERVPSAVAAANWAGARSGCEVLFVGGRRGWRVPSVEELLSLLGGPMPGHPFTLLSGFFYWTATTAPDSSTNARSVASTDTSLGLVTILSSAAKITPICADVVCPRRHVGGWFVSGGPGDAPHDSKKSTTTPPPPPPHAAAAAAPCPRPPAA